jgi:hypothetical protein
VACYGCLEAYDEAAVQEIRFLQGVYGFVVRDYNYDCMLAYRDSMQSAIVLAACASRHAGRLERCFASTVVCLSRFRFSRFKSSGLASILFTLCGVPVLCLVFTCVLCIMDHSK